MKKLLLFVSFGCLLSMPSTGHATYPITEWMSFIEKTLQDVTDTVAKIDFEEMLGLKEEKRKNQDPKADGNPKVVSTNKSSLTLNEYPPYVTDDLRKELEKEEPSIPEVEKLVRDTIVYKSETLEKGSLTERTSGTIKSDKSEKEKNSQEMQTASALISNIQQRSTARRILQKLSMAQTDSNDMKAEQKSKSTTGSLEKNTAASNIHRTHALVLDLSKLINGNLASIAYAVIPAEEAAEEKSMMDKAKDAAKAALGG